MHRYGREIARLHFSGMSEASSRHGFAPVAGHFETFLSRTLAMLMSRKKVARLETSKKKEGVRARLKKRRVKTEGGVEGTRRNARQQQQQQLDSHR